MRAVMYFYEYKKDIEEFDGGKRVKEKRRKDKMQAFFVDAW